MYGNSVGPPSHSAATVVTLRVLFAVAGLLTCGLLACVPLFRVALLRGRRFDWALAWVGLVVSVAGFAVVGSYPETDYRTDIAMAVLLLTGAGATAYFLVVDIRAYAAPRPFPGYPPPPHGSPTAPAGPGPYYGHRPAPGPTVFGGQPASPYAPTPVPQRPVPQRPVPPPPVPQPAVPPAPVPQPPPPRAPYAAPPARIDQVRAELDELSDYLRKHGGDGDREGGR